MSAPGALAVGQTVGSYQIRRELGRGGMGAVYEVVHVSLGRRAAMKVLLPEFSRQPAIVARFINEARAVNIIQHPGIVDIAELGTLPSGEVFIMMEFLEGESLGDRQKRLGRLDEATVLRLCAQVATALAAAHQKGIIHRDLKPDNVMVLRDPLVPGGERTKLVDFGIAKLAAEHADPNQGGLRTGTGVQMGTPAFMSPEQCRGAGGVGDRSDVYSLGAMLFALLAGRPPFTGLGPGDLMVQHIATPPPPLLGVTPAVAGLVARMLAKGPGDRPPMAAVAEELARLAQGPAAVVQAPVVQAPVVQAPVVQAPVVQPARPVAQPVSAPGAQPARLIVTSQNFFGQVFPLDKPATVIGRTDENDLVINHRSLSRHHAKVVREGGHFHIVDLQSANGVRVNGEEYGKVELRRGDKIDLGHVRLVFVPEGQDYELKGKGEDTEGSSGRSRLPLVIGAVVLLAGVGVTLKLVAPRLAGPRADPDSEVAKVLVDIDGDLLARRWHDAAAKAERVLKLAEVSPAQREVATTKKERAEQERRNHAAYERFSAAGGAGNYDEALKLYRDLAADSVYRQMAREQYDKMFPLFVINHLQKADAARRSGDCAAVTGELDAVLAVEPKHLQALALKEQPCPPRAAGATEGRGADTARRTAKAERPLPPEPKLQKPEAPAQVPPTEAEDNCDEVLKLAQLAYVQGDLREAIGKARPCGKHVRAWRIIGGAACQLKDLKLLAEAQRRLDTAGKQYVIYVCQRNSVVFDGRQFKLAD